MTGLRQRIKDRRPIDHHEGASGAPLERALLDDGTRLILKTIDPKHDLSVAIEPTGIVREIALWQSGVLDRLPPGISHAIMDTWEEDEGEVIAMRDLGRSMLGWHSQLDRAEVRGIFAAATAMHRAMRDEVCGVCMPFEQWATIFSHRVMQPLANHENGLPRGVLVGWHRFASLVPAEVADLVFRIHDDPGIVAGPLAADGLTMIHGDLWVNNVALEAGHVTLIDWALAARAAPILEFVSFLAGCADQVDATHDEIVEDMRQVMGADFPGEALHAALVIGLVQMGWNMALQVTEHEGRRAAESLEWWVAQARGAIDRGL